MLVHRPIDAIFSPAALRMGFALFTQGTFVPSGCSRDNSIGAAIALGACRNLATENVGIFLFDEILNRPANDIFPRAAQGVAHRGIDIESQGIAVNEPECFAGCLKKLFKDVDARYLGIGTHDGVRSATILWDNTRIVLSP
jgi:hypothetical protein